MGNLTENERHPVKRRSRRKAALAGIIVVVLLVVIAGMTVTGVVHWGSFFKKSEHIPAAVIWRARLLTRKANGGIPELSWSELWRMITHQRGFGLENAVHGLTVADAVKDPYDGDADLQTASRLFREQCALCHGKDGRGAEVGPPLNRVALKHGDSDFDIYRVIRDGVPGTAMHAPSLSFVQRWQLVGYIKHLQYGSVSVAAAKPLLNIHVSKEQVLSAGNKTDEWLTYSGSLDGHRYSPLAQITSSNVSRLRIRWVHQFDTSVPSIEATPLVVDGVIFTTEPPTDKIAVDAINARSGDLIWRYTRKVPAVARTCCGRMNRGVALLDNHIYLASLEGYLVCLDADTGRMVWQTQVTDPSHGYSLSLAPLIVNRSVVVGVAGAEYPIRGFLAAYDADTGKKQWQFDTIPGPGQPGHSSWSGDSWRIGGGSTWVTGSYDPALGLLYWGIGNPAPAYLGEVRAGDNLYTDSVVALHASTGSLAWYFQFTPHDVHDWDSAATPILANIPIKGKDRRVICFPNRNGFYYVLDRVTGKFLVGAPYVDQNWAKGLDAAGRPIMLDASERSNTWRLVKPFNGGTNFQNAAFNQKSGLIFVPAIEQAGLFRKSLKITPTIGEFFTGSGGAHIASQPPKPVVLALDSATGVKKWESFSPPNKGTLSYIGGNFGGLLATGGGLVFGSSGGYLFALNSATGREVWRVSLGGDTRSAPISFTVDGQQVVAVSAGRALFLFGL